MSFVMLRLSFAACSRCSPNAILSWNFAASFDIVLGSEA